VHIRSTGTQGLQVSRFPSVKIDEEKPIERGLGTECSSRASIYLPSAALRDVHASPAKRIDVELLQSGLVGERLGVGRAILLDDLELNFRPEADLIELKFL